MNGHQPRVFFTLNKFIRGILSDVVHRHDDFDPCGIFHKSKVKKPYISHTFIDSIIMCKSKIIHIDTGRFLSFHIHFLYRFCIFFNLLSY